MRELTDDEIIEMASERLDRGSDMFIAPFYTIPIFIGRWPEIKVAEVIFKRVGRQEISKNGGSRYWYKWEFYKLIRW